MGNIPWSTKNVKHTFHQRCKKKRPSRSEGLLEAPPRFELGVKDLQSSALPLGHGATQTAKLSYHTVSENASVFLDKAKPQEKISLFAIV